MKVKIAKWGNSLGVRLPKAAAAAARLHEGAEVDVVVEGGDVRLKAPARSSRRLFADMVAEMDRLGPANRPETVDWGPDLGAEIIDDDYHRGIIPAPGGRSRLGRSKANPGTGAGRRPTRRGAHGS